LQEYLNLTEHLYAIVTNGRLLRLLRDSTRLVRLSYVEFDLDRMFGEDLFADFAVFYRLLHVSRLPKTPSQSPDSLLELYHQDSLASGERIRDGLSGAVKQSILQFADGFLNHPKNDALRRCVLSDPEFSAHLYQHLLRLVYRLLFLMVIEERNLVYAADADARKRNLYYAHYSLMRLRRLADKRHLADGRHHDSWDALLTNFRLFDETGAGRPLGIEPLGGDLFDSGALGALADAVLDNDTLLACLRNLSLFRSPDTGSLMRVNYAALNVEEFGSVYQGLLEYEPQVASTGGRLVFGFAKGDERSRTGSHYTPEELVQPLLKHSLNYLIADALAKPTAAEKDRALLALKVCDVACGSGHILLAAARRIGTELAVLRTGDEQPSPSAFREAVRDVIRHCIYGMDLNPLAVELCKVALWLEAHVPGWPLSFLDHRIHCGNAIVGLAHRTELQRGIPDEAFKTLPGDDKGVAAALRKQNKEERKGQTSLDFAGRVEVDIRALNDAWRTFDQMPERSAADYYTRRAEYEKFRDNIRLRNLRLLADAQVAQFYLPKTPENRSKHITHETFSRWMEGLNPTGSGIAAAMTLAQRKRFGHWFIEFWDVVDAGGFDLIVGNPPYLGGVKLSGSYGHSFCEWVKWEYAPTGLSDLVVYFLRRIYDLLCPGGFVALITTNSIKDGDIREDGLEQIIRQNGDIVFVNSGMKWPGVASLYVSLLSIYKGAWSRLRVLDGRVVPRISAYFDESLQTTPPKSLSENSERLFAGYDILGEGFLISHQEAEQLLASDVKNKDVIFPSINGEELNNDPEQKPSRSVINFVDRTIGQARIYQGPFEIVEARVKPFREKQNRTRNREVWWLYNENRAGLRAALTALPHCFGAAATTKHLCFSKLPTHYVFTHAIKVLATARWSDFAVLQSTLHEVWARKYSGSLETRLRYSPTDCFATFPFPRDSASEVALTAIGETYHERRCALMRGLWVGLTDLYNLFHDPNLTPELVTASLGDRATITGDEGFNRLQRLRDLHRELDQTILAAYGWHTLSDFGPALALRHDFHPLDFLPENDRIRLTLHPEARREVLARLLKLNHQRAEQAEQLQKQILASAPVAKKKKIKAVKPVEVAPRKHSKGINFKRGAIASYAVNRLGDRWEFGRIQMEKVLYLAQQEIGVDLEMEFQHGLNGPFDEEIHKLESLAAKSGWFLATPRPGNKGTSYQRGPAIADRCGAAASILGEAKSKFDSILDWLAKMDTERAEIWATVHAVWNEMLLAKQPVSDETIIQGVYAWHPAKARFVADRISACIGWMRKEGFIPRGIEFETRVQKPVETELELGLDLFDRAEAPVPSPTWMDRPLVLPSSRRVVLTPDRYRAALVPHLLFQAGGSVSFERLRKAYWLLTEPQTLERYATGAVGETARGWKRAFGDTLQKDMFIEHLKGAVGRQLHFIRKDGERWLDLRDPKVADDEHIIFDARLALLVADLWPVAEPIAPLAPAEETAIQQLEVVL
jgi:methylase of polypeptide subunit release factors